MSYISAVRKNHNNTVLVWERCPDTGERIEKYYPAPLYFYYDDPDGEYTTFKGTKVSKIEFDTINEWYQARQTFERDRFRTGVTAWESDITPELRVLSREYYDKPAPKLHVTLYDIEVDTDPNRGFATIDNPYAPINAISLFNRWTNELHQLFVNPNKYKFTASELRQAMDEIVPIPNSHETIIHICEDEAELLTQFIVLTKDSDLLCGWNSEMFDHPYVYKRVEILFGNDAFKYLNFPNAPKATFQEITVFGRSQEKVNQIGKVLTDYMLLIKKYEPGERRSFKLAAIEEEKELGLPKLEFDGSLAEIYNGVNTSQPDLATYDKDQSYDKLTALQFYREMLKVEMTARGLNVDTVGNENVLSLIEMKTLSESCNELSDDDIQSVYDSVTYELGRMTVALFARYNIRDSEILNGFENKLGYIEVANMMVHMSTGLFDHVLGTLKLHDLALVNFSHYHRNQVVPNIRMPEIDRGIQGAFVVETVSGLYKWAGSIDITSLYPTAIMLLNMSPETIIGQFLEEFKAAELFRDNVNDAELTLKYLDGRLETKTVKEWRAYLTDVNWAVSGYGVIFDQNVKGMVPAILEDWFSKRVEYKNKMRDVRAEQHRILESSACDVVNDSYVREGIQLDRETAKLYDELTDKAAYYNRLQSIFKIKLNSLYGGLSNVAFRFYELLVAESTTANGRLIERHQLSKVNEALTGIYDPKGEAIIAGDTDSCYFKLDEDSTQEEAVAKADAVAKVVNDSFPEFANRTFLISKERGKIIKSNREYVMSGGIWVKKKHYICRVVDEEGESTNFIKVMGLAIKKTVLPADKAKLVEDTVVRLVDGEDWHKVAVDFVKIKDQLANSGDIFSLGLPKGVNSVEKYTEAWRMDENTRLPGHVAAAINYNNLLQEYGDTRSPKIMSGDKIRVFYLKDKIGRFTSVALPTDIDEVPDWFNKLDIDVDAHIERLLDKPFENIVTAIGQKSPTHQTLLIDDLMEF